ncbi:MLO-like protein 13 isoform X1 [Amaranthus tricolor]|uniref:MLO-like protein 13 isoform X1 n=2 Tax=Amaranthus tricolor TaxID=29722 RepID=UPI002586FD98|nr:MLO-like protein 13 isoform X1 [Amaranthus tricolor]
MAEEDSSFELTPTWIIAAVCFIIVLISLIAERGLHRLGKCLKSNGQESLFSALQKIKEELMLLGFISLLLTVFQGFIKDICIPKHLTYYMLPCKRENVGHEGGTHKDYAFQTSWNKRRLLAEGSNRCAEKGQAQFLSLEALHHLHIFIFVLALVYVVFCAATMILGGLKVRRWKHWEDAIQHEIAKSETESNRLNKIQSRHRYEFIKQRRGYSTIIGFVISFVKQFYGSVTKSDYFTLRHGFLMTHCPANFRYNFHKYMLRTLEYDFKKVVGISWYLWLFVVLFLLINLKGLHIYFWLSFLPLILLLVVGAKLEHIIICLAEEIEEKKENKVQSSPEMGPKKPWVKPSDKHFWFGRPSLFLYLIHFILFQNSFEIAFFLWVLCTFGIHSCILDKVGFIVTKIVIGLLVQVMCSYSTLPLYTIVTQMGSAFKEGIFTENVQAILNVWSKDAQEHGRGSSTSNRFQMQNMAPELREIVSQETDFGVERNTP